jgi:hypothetical protein
MSTILGLRERGGRLEERRRENRQGIKGTEERRKERCEEKRVESEMRDREQRSKIREQRSRGAEGQRSRGAEEQRSRGAEEQRPYLGMGRKSSSPWSKAMVSTTQN